MGQDRHPQRAIFHFMSIHIIVPQRGMLRELSPEISPEEKQQLVLDLPTSCRPDTHPLAVFLRRRWHERAVGRREAAERLGTGKNINKTLRRIDQVLHGERMLPDVMAKIVDLLEIDEGELAAAWQQAEKWQADRDSWGLLVERHRCYHRFGPYLSPLLPKSEGECPLARVPYKQTVESLYEVHGNPAPEELTAWLAEHEHCWVIGKYAIAGWVYHRSPQEIHYYRADGAHLHAAPAHSPPPEEVWQVRASKWF
jgi:hypothetical protein